MNVPLLVTTQTAVVATLDSPLRLDSGQLLHHAHLAYETYGQLNPERTNAILVCHALTGDAHAAGYHGADDRKPGWWNDLIGPGKALDTDRYFVVCSNVLGGCKGSTGPSSINPATGQRYGLSFPVVTIGDMVHAQARLLDILGIDKLLAVVGGSLGGFQAQEWSIRYPQRVQAVIALATATRVSAQAIAFNAVGRHAIIKDPLWQNGQYDPQAQPEAGLATARMMAHITYLSETSLEAKFGRRLQSPNHELRYDFAGEFAVESYLDYQGRQFTQRFDANSYLYLTKAMDYFDLASQYGGSLQAAFEPVEAQYLVASFSSDWLFPPGESVLLSRTLTQLGKRVFYWNVPSTAGHDAFLLEHEALTQVIRPFLERVATPLEAGRPHV